VSDELVYPDVAAKLVGRDMRIFKLLCSELGVEAVKRGSNDVFRMKDVERIRRTLKKRARAWTQGERSRSY
jgi:phosphate starvation-inducible protein PhoH